MRLVADRLGVLGFLVTDDTVGNQAIKDQRAALEWTRDNIANFGGDPNSVTIGGQSAGAMSVIVHLVSKASAGLFHRAILESPVAGFQYQRAEVQREVFGKKFAKLAGCASGNTTCLRALSARTAIGLGEQAAGAVGAAIIDRLLEGGRIEDAFAMQWAPVVDGSELAAQPLELFEKGLWNKVPLLIGTNQDEGATFVYDGVDTWLPEALFPDVMDGIFGRDGGNVTSFYRTVSSSWHDLRDSLSYVLTDFWFKCASARFALLADSQGQPSWSYRFQHVPSFAKLFTQYLPKVCESRTCHAVEIPFIFNNFANYSSVVSADEKVLSSRLLAFWSNFIAHGDPNTGSPVTIPWPRFNGSARLNLRAATPSFGVESTKVDQPGAMHTPGVCEFYDEIGYKH